jgi:hypothetical protein
MTNLTGGMVTIPWQSFIFVLTTSQVSTVPKFGGIVRHFEWWQIPCELEVSPLKETKKQ